MDAQWWSVYGDDVERNFVGTRYSNGATKYAQQLLKLNNYGNSGAGAISLAIAGGAKKVILLGYDCQHTGGKAHWHGNHPKGMGNAAMTDKWAENFMQISKDFLDVEIINASRETALTCFKRKSFDEATR